MNGKSSPLDLLKAFVAEWAEEADALVGECWQPAESRPGTPHPNWAPFADAFEALSEQQKVKLGRFVWDFALACRSASPPGKRAGILAESDKRARREARAFLVVRESAAAEVLAEHVRRGSAREFYCLPSGLDVEASLCRWQREYGPFCVGATFNQVSGLTVHVEQHPLAWVLSEVLPPELDGISEARRLLEGAGRLARPTEKWLSQFLKSVPPEDRPSPSAVSRWLHHTLGIRYSRQAVDGLRKRNRRNRTT